MNNLSTMASVVQNTVSNTAPNVEYGGQSMTANESYGIEYVDPPHIAYIIPDQFTWTRPQNNVFRYTTTPVASESIDLTSPSSSHGLRQFSQVTARTGDGFKLQSIYDRQRDDGPRNSAPYRNSAIIQNNGSSMNNVSAMASVVQNSVSYADVNRNQHIMNIVQSRLPQLRSAPEQQRQQNITDPNVVYGGQSMTVNGSYGIVYVNPPHLVYITPDQFTWTRPQNNVLRNTTTPVASEIIDLTSLPSSPGRRQFSQDTARTGDGRKRQSIYDRHLDYELRNRAPFRLLKSTLEGKMINCINVDPYIYTDLLVTLHDVTQRVLPLCSVNRCAHILYNYLNIQLHRANAVQTNLLRQLGRYRFFCPTKSPLVRLEDVNRVLSKLKFLGYKCDQEIQLYHNKVKRYPRRCKQ